MKPDKNNFAPRVGLVYKLNDSMVLRGGYGIFYNLFDRVGCEDQIALNPPRPHQHQPGQRASASGPLFLLRTASGRLPARSTSTPPRAELSPLRIRAVSDGRAQETMQQASVGFAARALAQAWCLSVDGVWTEGRNLANLVNLNQPLPNAAATLGPLPYPTSASSSGGSSSGRSDYKGIDLGLEKRFSERLQLRRRLHALGLEDNTVRAPVHAGLASFPQDAVTSTPGTAPATTTSATAWPSTSWSSCRSAGKKYAQTASAQGPPRRLDRLRHLRRPLRPSVHGQPEQQQRRPDHDRPAQPRRRRRRARRRWTSGSTRPRSRPCPRAPSATSRRNILRGPGWQSFDLTLPKRLGVGSASARILRWDIFNVFNTDEPRPAQPRTSRTRPPWARSRTLARRPADDAVLAARVARSETAAHARPCRGAAGPRPPPRPGRLPMSRRDHP